MIERENLRDDELCFERQYDELSQIFNSKYIRFTRLSPPEGCLGSIRFVIDLSGLTNPRTGKPAYAYVNETQKTTSISGKMTVYRGHPNARPTVAFDDGSTLYHPNSYGKTFCVGKHKNYVLSAVFDRLFRACVYDVDPFYRSVNLDSPACKSAIPWMNAKIASGEFPLLPFELLLNETPGNRKLPAPSKCDQVVRRGLPPAVKYERR